MTKSTSNLSYLVRRSGIRPITATGADDPEIAGATLDSRSAREGDVFFAIPGFRDDGAAFAGDAIRRGARAVMAAVPRPADVPEGIAWIQVDDPRKAAGLLSRECYGRPDEGLTLVGVTGTNGKTTVTHIVESIGRAAGRRSGRIGTMGYAYDGNESSLSRTTPEAPELYRLLAEMLEADVELVAMEVSSHALSLNRVEGARFAVAAFLNLSPDHLDFHGDEAAYFEAKCRLFRPLGPDQAAVLPADTERGRALRERTGARVLTFGRSADAAVRLTEEHCGLEGSSAILETPAGKLPIRTFLLGNSNLDNVAAAAACALALELPTESIPAGVLALEGVTGRLEKVDEGQPFTVIVDYAHTSAALEKLLGWIGSVAVGGTIVVFGCGGSRDTGKRPEMGRIAATHADRVILTSDNPRDEDPAKILEQIHEGVSSVSGGSGRCRTIEDREAAIVEAIGEARPGDAVVIAGKGHEATQTAGGSVRQLDDRDVARRALNELGWEK